jgi:hypothetical protein
MNDTLVRILDECEIHQLPGTEGYKLALEESEPMGPFYENPVIVLQDQLESGSDYLVFSREGVRLEDERFYDICVGSSDSPNIDNDDFYTVPVLTERDEDVEERITETVDAQPDTKRILVDASNQVQLYNIERTQDGIVANGGEYIVLQRDNLRNGTEDEKKLLALIESGGSS